MKTTQTSSCSNSTTTTKRKHTDTYEEGGKYFKVKKKDIQTT